MSELNTIPPINSPLGRHWTQPNVQNILIDDTHALMEDSDFNELKDYSHSIPSGVYPGKMWKRKAIGLWYLSWYGAVKNDSCKINSREIIKIEKDG